MAYNYICMCKLNYIEEIIHQEIVRCYPRSWQEDHITYSWLQKLITEWPSIGLAPHPTTSVLWDAYKMDGALEEKNGDIAFLIELHFNNGNTLQGVGFLEAKRIYETKKFAALDQDQLRLLGSNSSSHQLLLYDYKPINTRYSMGACFPSLYCKEFGYNYCQPSDFSAAIVVPSIHAIAYKEKGRELESIGSRLSEQIVLRYFRGLDLNFDAELVKRVLAGVADGAKFLAVARVQVGEEFSLAGSDGSPERKPIKPNEASGYRLIERDSRSNT